jgi:hypothetical protein
VGARTFCRGDEPCSRGVRQPGGSGATGDGGLGLAIAHAVAQGDGGRLTLAAGRPALVATIALPAGAP